MKKHLGLIIAIIILAAGGYYVFTHNQAKAPAEEVSQTGSNTQDNKATTSSDGTNLNVNVAPLKTDVNFSNGESDAMNPDIQAVEIVYDGSKFTPSTVSIKVGDYVFFKNQSTVDFWPASGPHPTHTAYPEFDAKKRIAPGDEFKFQFTKVGSWSFHDHLNPSAHGVVNVAQ